MFESEQPDIDLVGSYCEEFICEYFDADISDIEYYEEQNVFAVLPVSMKSITGNCKKCKWYHIINEEGYNYRCIKCKTSLFLKAIPTHIKEIEEFFMKEKSYISNNIFNDNKLTKMLGEIVESIDVKIFNSDMFATLLHTFYQEFIYCNKNWYHRRSKLTFLWVLTYRYFPTGD